MLSYRITSRKTDRLVLTTLAAVVVIAGLVYASVPKTTTVQLPRDQAPSWTLTYTGLGIHGSGFLGFRPLRIVGSGTGGYDPGRTTLTMTPAAGGWALCERAEQGAFRMYGFVTASVPVGGGILVPDLPHHLNASYFYSPDGSATGSIREGSGSYDIINPKGILHVQVTGGRETISKSPGA